MTFSPEEKGIEKLRFFCKAEFIIDSIHIEMVSKRTQDS